MPSDDLSITLEAENDDLAENLRSIADAAQEAADAFERLDARTSAFNDYPTDPERVRRIVDRTLDERRHKRRKRRRKSN